MENFFLHRKCPRTYFVRTVHVPKKTKKKLLSRRQSSLNMLRIRFVVIFFTLVVNVITVLIELVNFRKVKKYNFTNFELINPAVNAFLLKMMHDCSSSNRNIKTNCLFENSMISS